MIDQQPASAPSQAPKELGSDHPLPGRARIVKTLSSDPGKAARWGMSSPFPLHRRGDCDLTEAIVELVQRRRLILDVSSADLDASEAAFGAFHATTWHFRNSLTEAHRSWELLRAELGTAVLEVALAQPPVTTLTLSKQARGSPHVVLVLIGGKTYCAQQVTGTELAPIQWRLTRLHPPLEDGPYYVCRLANRSTQCDCAEWTYRIAESSDGRDSLCKHLAALSSLGWI